MVKRGKKNKRAEELLINYLTYILFILVVFSLYLVAVSMQGSKDSLNEKIYARQIALSIDKIQACSKVELDVYELQKTADKNNIRSFIKIDNENNLVSVKISNSGGHSYYYFVSNPVKWVVDKSNSKLILESEC